MTSKHHCRSIVRIFLAPMIALYAVSFAASPSLAAKHDSPMPSRQRKYAKSSREAHSRQAAAHRLLEGDVAFEPDAGFASLWISPQTTGAVRITFSCMTKSPLAAILHALGLAFHTRFSAAPQGSRYPGIPFFPGNGNIVRDDDGFLSVSERLSGIAPRTGGLRHIVVDASALRIALRQAGVKTCTILVQMAGFPVARIAGPATISRMHVRDSTYWSGELSTSNISAPSRIDIVFGYTRRQLERSLSPLPIILAAIFIAAFSLWALILRRIDRAGSATQRAFQSFTFSSAVQWLLIAMWILWVPAVIATRASAVMDFLAGPGPASALHVGTFGLLAPCLIALVLSALSYSVHKRATQCTASLAEYMQGTVVAQLWLVPLYMLLCAFQELYVSLDATVVWLGAASLTVWARSWFSVAFNPMTPTSLVAGELYKSAQTLAQRAGVRLGGLLILPTAKMNVANAFATKNNIVMLTDLLLTTLPRPEIDAILAHEIAHLKYRHVSQVSRVFIGTVVAAIVARQYLAQTHFGSISAIAVYVTVVVLGYGIAFGVSRRNEFQADAGAAVLTNQPQAIISALARLKTVSGAPLDWSPLREIFSTHPSTTRRAAALSNLAGYSIPIAPIVVDESAEGNGAAAATYYAIPPEHTASQTRRFVMVSAITSSYLGYAVTCAAAVCCELAAGRYHVAGDLAIPALVATAIVAFAARRLFVALWGSMRFALLEKSLRGKLKPDEKLPTGPDGVRFVGLSPGLNTRIFNGSFEYDFGFLSLADDAVHYLGEKASFAVPARAVTSVALRPILPLSPLKSRVALTLTLPPEPPASPPDSPPSAPASPRQCALCIRPFEAWAWPFSNESALLLRSFAQWQLRAERNAEGNSEASAVQWTVPKASALVPTMAAPKRTTIVRSLQMLACGSAAAVAVGIPVRFTISTDSALYAGVASALTIVGYALPYWLYRDAPARLHNAAPLQSVAPPSPDFPQAAIPKPSHVRPTYVEQTDADGDDPQSTPA